MPGPSVDDTDLMRSALAEFDRLSDLDQAARDATLVGLSAANPKLHARVLSFLRAARDASSAGFLDGNAEQMLASSAAEPVSELSPGIAFGPYRLERRLGTGGMGEVWLGRRSDGLFEGVVAIKTLHAHLSHPAIRARFAREGQFLGRLSHPQIARLIDAGVSPDGTLFLVLEYVDGVRLDQWCDERRLDIESRLKLVLDVCEAVSHAHSHLVVHRDLKPSNILVTTQGEVKLLDFGIAKLIEADGAAQTELTRIGGRALTPEYAAPEQVLGSPITAGTDVYALGVLVYGLLSGAHPYGATHSTLAQIERDVLYAEPLPLNQMAAHAVPRERSAAERATDRSSTPSQLRKRLKGDLEIIVGQALKKKPEERYVSVATFAADLRRHLHHEPITARPDSLAYRTAKFVRRYRTGVVAASLVMLALIAGLSVSLWQAELARQEAQRADAEARKAGAVKDFLIGIFQRNSAQDADGTLAANTTARTLLDQGARDIRTQLGGEPALRAELLGVIGELYTGMLLTDEAIPLLQEQLAALARLPDSPAIQVRRIVAHVKLGAGLVDAARYEEARGLLESALASMDMLGDHDSAERVQALTELGAIAYWTRPDNGQTATRYFNAALDIATARPERAARRPELLMRLGMVALDRGDLRTAENNLRGALALHDAAGAAAPAASVAEVRSMLGEVLRRQQRFVDAEIELREALTLRERIFPTDSPWIADSRVLLAKLLGDIGRREEAQALLRQALAGAATRGANDPDLVAEIRLDLGRLMWLRGLPDAAAAEWLAVLPLHQKKEEGRLDITLTRLARLRIAQGQYAETEAFLHRARPLIENGLGMHSRAYLNLQTIEAELLLAQGKYDAAGPLLAQAADVWAPDDERLIDPAVVQNRWATAQQTLAVGRPDLAEAAMRALLEKLRASPQAALLGDEEAHTRFWLGEALRRARRHADAEAELRQAIRLRESLDDPASIWLAGARIALCRTLIATHRRPEARSLLAQAEAALSSQPMLSATLLQPLADARKELAAKVSVRASAVDER